MNLADTVRHDAAGASVADAHKVLWTALNGEYVNPECRIQAAAALLHYHGLLQIADAVEELRGEFSASRGV